MVTKSPISFFCEICIHFKERDDNVDTFNFTAPIKKLQKGIKCFQILMERCVFNNKG